LAGPVGWSDHQLDQLEMLLARSDGRALETGIAHGNSVHLGHRQQFFLGHRDDKNVSARDQMVGKGRPVDPVSGDPPQNRYARCRKSSDVRNFSPDKIAFVADPDVGEIPQVT